METDSDALVRTLLERAVQPEPPSEEECRRVYEAESRKFRTPALFEASHILIEVTGDDPADWARAESQARLIATEVGDSRESFTAAAREFSNCPSARQDGSLGQIRRGELAPVLQHALESLQPGTTARDPIRSRFGWHVLRLERRMEGRQLPFEIVRAKIADMLEARAWVMASGHYIAELARGASIEGIDLAPPEAGSR
jgi:peptidyl-prolyl cis-trans isomerase C